MKYHKDHVLAFSCPHAPFEHPNFIDFLLTIRDRVKCGTIVCVGDLVDNHSFSPKFDADPDGRSPADEIEDAQKHLIPFFKSFPKVFLCLGNHDRRVDLKAKHVHLPKKVFKPFRKIWDLPKGWKDRYFWEIDGVKYMHGNGYSGDMAHMKAANCNRQSTVIGHIHHICTMGYTASEKDCIFGMAVGCGIDRKRYAFAYERDFPKKPLLGCGIVTDNGRYAQVFKMEL